MKIAIVGAGVAGLACARNLAIQGHELTIFEKSRGPGGRCATRRIGDFVFDSGATSIAPRGLALENVLLHELPTDQLHKVQKPVWTMAFGRISSGDAGRGTMPRYTYVNGINTLGKLLAEGMNIRLESRIDAIAKSGDEYIVQGESFQVVVLNPPLPQSQILLTSLGDSRELNAVGYRPCLSVLLGFDQELPEQPFHALVDAEQVSPLIWLSIESQKSPHRAPAGKTALVAQLGSQFSRDHYEDSEGELVHESMVHIRRLFGNQLALPVVSQVMRWRFAQPETHWTFEEINQPGERVVVIGDGIAGARIEFAYESGVKAADHISKL